MDNLQDRFFELYDRAYTRNKPEFTKFLGLEEKRILGETYLPAVLNGGYDGAERVVAGFGEVERFPILYVKISPKGEKWAENLTHRDFLGALMGLQISRELIGDILISGKTAYAVCLDTAAEFIKQNLTEVRKTAVVCEILGELPPVALPEPQTKEFVVASLRIDAVVSSVWSISRSTAKALFEESKVLINSRPQERPEKEIKENDIISLRGYGRIKFLGIKNQTSKSKLRIIAQIF